MCEMVAEAMAFHSKRINYTVYPPDFTPEMGCWDYRTVTKARRAAMKLGRGARLRRNVNARHKSQAQTDWWVERVWEWNEVTFVDITNNPAKGLP
jgi:hypothetical protein